MSNAEEGGKSQKCFVVKSLLEKKLLFMQTSLSISRKLSSNVWGFVRLLVVVFLFFLFPFNFNILFYVCSHRGGIDKNKKKLKHIIIIYTNFPTGL